jgi:lysophospholipase L1-like esterase
MAFARPARLLLAAAGWLGVGCLPAGPRAPISVEMDRRAPPAARPTTAPRLLDALPSAPPPAEAATPGLACPPLRVEMPELVSSSIDVPIPAIVDPRGSLSRFHERVAALLRGRAKHHVRIAVFGDSNMTMDWITGEMRRVLQGKYGDGGHGYVALGRPWNWYRHMDVRSGYLRGDWTAFAVSTHPSPERAYGFAGIAARSERRGAVNWVATADDPAPIGTRVSRFELYYLKKPNGGAFELLLDGQKQALVSTAADTLEAGFYQLSAPDAPHKLEIVTTTIAPVTVFGVALERDRPSFVIDSLGVGAVSGPLLLRQNKEVMRASLAQRGYDLVVLLLGSNQVWPVKYASWMGELIARISEALPEAAVLITTPVDQVAGPTATRSLPDVVRVARQNENIARDNGCAFWDFRGAMGGDAAMVRFIATAMGHADGIHLTPKGARYMARRMTHALLANVDRHLEARPEAGCSENVE